MLVAIYEFPHLISVLSPVLIVMLYLFKILFNIIHHLACLSQMVSSLQVSHVTLFMNFSYDCILEQTIANQLMTVISFHLVQKPVRSSRYSVLLLFQANTRLRCTTGRPVLPLARLSVPWLCLCSSPHWGRQPCSITECNQMRACEWVNSSSPDICPSATDFLYISVYKENELISDLSPPAKETFHIFKLLPTYKLPSAMGITN